MIKVLWNFTKNSDGTNETDASQTEISKKYSGAYLVASVTTYFNNKTPCFYQKMTLIKNGFNDKGSASLLEQDNKNLVNNIDNDFISGLAPLGKMSEVNNNTAFESALEKVTPEKERTFRIRNIGIVKYERTKNWRHKEIWWHL